MLKRIILLGWLLSVAAPACAQFSGAAASSPPPIGNVAPNTISASQLIVTGAIQGQIVRGQQIPSAQGDSVTNGFPRATLGSGSTVMGGPFIVTQLTPPTNLTCTCAGGTGTTRYYSVTSVECPNDFGNAGDEAVAYTQVNPVEGIQSANASCSGPTTLGPTAYCTVNWTPVIGACGYNVYGRVTTQSSQVSLTGQSSPSYVGGVIGSSWTDYGFTATTHAAPTTNLTGSTYLYGEVATGDASLNPNFRPGDVQVKETSTTHGNIYFAGTNVEIIGNTSANSLTFQATADIFGSGNAIQSTGGTKPTCSAATGTCATATGSTNNRGQIQLAGGTAVTTITLTFSAAGVWKQAPFCIFTDGNATITPLAYSAGAISTSTAVVDFVSASAANINYVCM